MTEDQTKTKEMSPNGETPAAPCSSLCYPVSLATMAELAKGDAGGMVPLSLGELFGPARCEHGGCTARAWNIWMTEAEYWNAKEHDSPVTFVFENSVGRALCDDHRPTG